MKAIEFQDIDGSKITIQHGGSGYRIYVKERDTAADEVGTCIHMTGNQATILIAALQDLLDD